MHTQTLLCSAALAAALAASSPSAAQSLSRQVIVNGEVLNGKELLVFDTLNCGDTVPDGSYWLNINGAWGFQGGPKQGVVGDQCRAAQASGQDQKSECESKYRYWEDRMANCYGVQPDLNTVIYPK